VLLDHGKLVTLSGGSSKRRCLLLVGNRSWWRSVNEQKPQCYAENNRTVFNCMQW